MITLKKSRDDFKILNLTDPQFSDDEWLKPEFARMRNILTRTITELVERVHPDLITISGDLAWAGHFASYRCLADFIDGFGVPWAPVWGNHDNQCGAECVQQVVDDYVTRKHILYEQGDPALGNGNYVIAIEEDGRVVTGLIMMDSHDSAPYTDADGTEKNGYARLIPEQLDWYREQVALLAEKGCRDTVMILHIPIYAYRQAFRAAIREDLEPISYAALIGNGWNKEHADTVGVALEGISCHPIDDGVFDVIKELGSTKHVLCGHDHVINTMIDYQGVKLIYGLKTGPGCYWSPVLNGGTVLTVTSGGVSDVRHEYVHQQ